MGAAGNFFEDFRLGQEFRHAPPRTVTEADATLYAALYGSRFPLHGARTFAKKLGFAETPLDDLLVFHVVFGKSVPDFLNAVANLGYASAPRARLGDTLSARSTVIGLMKTPIASRRRLGQDRRRHQDAASSPSTRAGHGAQRDCAPAPAHVSTCRRPCRPPR